MKNTAVLILEDGSKFYGKSIGVYGINNGEIVFNTSMTGYQEILTDPSYENQIITFTYPHIGNVGVNKNDEESKFIHAKGVIIKNISPIASNYRSEETLQEYLKKKNILTITNIDTRKLTKKIRKTGSQKGCIVCLKKIPNFKNYKEILKYKKLKFSKKNDCKKIKINNINNKKKYLYKNFISLTYEKFLKIKKKHIVIYNFGIKNNIIKMLLKKKCKLTIVPQNTKYNEILQLSPDGIFLSNGPGDPRKLKKSIKSIKKLMHYNFPMFGICLGHQILGLANKAKIIKMKFGHHGGNHPVQNVKTKKIIITSQNHNYVIEKNTLPKNIKITYISLFDYTIQGISIKNKPIFSFQGHPESNPGPNDASFLFKYFIKLINKKKIKI
ncbi:MAG: glutamine-hydrolyzing carbamoyl-phosphate synthase small subunit [Buchnera aphidicola (Periphyllus acericola)]|uniref:glutamine-hydrolyzing carbamoyl-phosphate synthase small subunit n=1 Tax=Buchnera aphidicola TaxID=9 RepID=UPI0030D1FCCA|nr:glutamine-hydrolyzing carbamoyl-phosphate synthase small subunit [Buchnera aphidicola (Periphyllus acericola)]